MSIISISGLIGSGKDTIADYLVANHGYVRMSFASTLKDAVSAVFGWDREMLEGRTDAARKAREQVDPWWADRLGIPHLTPRWVLQYWGTDVLRGHFHDDIWIASLEYKLKGTTEDVVITDCRFPNEITAVRNAGGRIVRVRRGEDPEWFNTAHVTPSKMKELYPEIHASEYSWAATKFDFTIYNDKTLDALYSQVKYLVSGLKAPNH